MTNSIDDSICLEESSSLFDDSASFQVAAASDQKHGDEGLCPFNLSNQNLEELLFQPDSVDAEPFLLKSTDHRNSGVDEIEDTY